MSAVRTAWPIGRAARARIAAGALVGALCVLAGCPRPAPVAPDQPMRRDAYARYLEGKLAGYRGDWAAAADALAEAAAAAPDQPMVAVELARAQSKAKRAEAARDTLAAARQRWPDHPQVWLVSGDLLAAGEPVAAIAAYQRAIELAPDDEHAYLGLARLQRGDAAEDTLRTLLANVPSSVDGMYGLAVRLAQRGAHAEAAAALRQVLERDPDHLDARLDLARTLRRSGKLRHDSRGAPAAADAPRPGKPRPDSRGVPAAAPPDVPPSPLDLAIVETRSAFDRSGQALDIAEELFWLLCEADDREAAIDLLTLLDDEHSDAEALAVVARLSRGLGRIAEARAIARRITEVDSEAGAIALAEIQLVTGERSAVRATLAAIAGDARLAAVARRLTAEAALDAGAPAEALAVLGITGAGTAAAPARPAALDTALVAAFALADLGRRGEAEAVLAGFGGAAGSPEHTAAVIARARLAERTGDVAATLAILEPLIRSQPDAVIALNLAGYVLADAGQRLDDAERYLRRARELSPGDPAILDSWGWLQLRRGQTRAAVRTLDHAARFAPLEPEILAHLAAAWAADGAPRTAADILARAAGLGPAPAIARRIAAIRQTLPRSDTMRR